MPNPQEIEQEVFALADALDSALSSTYVPREELIQAAKTLLASRRLSEPEMRDELTAKQVSELWDFDISQRWVRLRLAERITDAGYAVVSKKNPNTPTQEETIPEAPKSGLDWNGLELAITEELELGGDASTIVPAVKKWLGENV